MKAWNLQKKTKIQLTAHCNGLINQSLIKYKLDTHTNYFSHSRQTRYKMCLSGQKLKHEIWKKLPKTLHGDLRQIIISQAFINIILFCNIIWNFTLSDAKDDKLAYAKHESW